MISIDKHNQDVQFALSEHLRYTKCFIAKRTGRKVKCIYTNCPVCNSKLSAVTNIPSKISVLLSDDDFLEAIISQDPPHLEFYNELFFRDVLGDYPYDTAIEASRILSKNRSHEQQFYYKNYCNYLTYIKKIFDYDGWFVSNEPSSYYSAYHLSSYLGIRSCVYCNRTYTVSQFKPTTRGKIGKLIRPQFDHWFPKEKFPLLALSFFNLIPSCSICNSSVKGRTHYTVEEYIHPYIDNILDSVTFSYSHVTIDLVKVEVVGVNQDYKLETRINNTLKGFYIEEMYNAHHSELRDLLKIKQAYSESYLKSLKDAFPDVGLTENEIYRLAFGVELDSSDFHKRPFSKFKYDILKEIGII